MIHPLSKTRQEPFSQKSAAHSLPNHCICRKNCSAVCFALHLLFECGILCLLWKNAGAVCRPSDEEKEDLEEDADDDDEEEVVVLAAVPKGSRDLAGAALSL